MAGFRVYFAEAEKKPAGRVSLSREESHHLARVLRARPGDVVELMDGCGHVGQAVVAGIDGRELVLEVSGWEEVSLPACSQVLAQAIPKGKTMDGVLRRVTEIGVHQVVPLVTARTEVRLEPKKASGKRGHWEQVVLEACKQSGNPWAPEIAPVCGFAEWVSALSDPGPGECRLMGSLLPGAGFLSTVWPSGKVDRVLWAIGPEGDFTAEEYEALSRAGFRAVTLGTHVLRVETAVSVALGQSLLMIHSQPEPGGAIGMNPKTDEPLLT